MSDGAAGDRAALGAANGTVRPKVFFLTRSLDLAGAERQLVELASGLHRAGWDVVVATFYGGGALEQPLRNSGVAVVALEKKGRWDVLLFGLRLIRLLRREQPDIIHGYLAVPNIAAVLLRRAVPRARVVWGVRASNLEIAQHHDVFVQLEHHIGVWLSKFVDLVICNSEAGCAYLQARGYACNIVVVPNGIDTEYFAPDADARAEFRAHWNVGKAYKLVGLVARLHPMKGHVTFIEAAAKLVNARKDVKFVCIGDGPIAFRDELAQLTKARGLSERFIWSPARAEIARVYNALDVLVSSSVYGEGFSNVIAEAMASGVPCVATDVGDSRRLVRDLGWVCPPDDPDALAQAITRVLDALPAESLRLRQHIVNCYSPDLLVNRSVEHLGQLLFTRSPPSAPDCARSVNAGL